MAFIHSLVRWDDGNKFGWIAPFELGDQTPGYVSYVVPVDRRRGLFDEYLCEVAYTGNKKAAKRNQFKIVRTSPTTLMLEIEKNKLWFREMPLAKGRTRLPYLGKACHEDFEFPLIEIEPTDFDAMDRLCDESGMFIIGCDPFVHYGGVNVTDSNGRRNRKRRH